MSCACEASSCRRGQRDADILVRKTLDIAENAEPELRAILPEKIAARVDWSTLKTERGSFGDPDAREWHADLLFSAKIAGREALLYLLLEHQSTVDRCMPKPMLTYIDRLWSSRLADGASHLPVVLPPVLHHSESGWTASLHLVDQLDADGELLALPAP